MNTFIKKLSHLKILNMSDYLFIIVLYLINIIIRLTISFGSFKTLTQWLGHGYHRTELSSLITPEQMDVSRRVSLVVNIIDKTSPWHTKCFAQSILARIMLGFYKIPYVAHLGVTLNTEEVISMKAHAWIKVANRVVTGRNGHRAYTIIGTFIDKSIIENIQ